MAVTGPFTSSLVSQYEVPWTHWVVDEFLPAGACEDLYRDATSDASYEVLADDEFGLRYAAPSRAELAAWFLSTTFVTFLRELTGGWYRPSSANVQYRRLDVRHPLLPAHVDDWHDVSLVVLLYLTPGWRPAMGGQLSLHSSQDAEPAVRVAPVKNRLVVFEGQGDHWHSVEPVLVGERHSIMVEWLPLDAEDPPPPTGVPDDSG